MIPAPLLPLEMNIGQDSVYRQQGGTMGGDRGRTAGAFVRKDGTKPGHTSNSAENVRTKWDQHGTRLSENEVALRSGNSVASTGCQSVKVSGGGVQGTGVKGSVNQVTGQSEFTMDVDIGVGNVPTRTTRSIRGARSRGHAAYGGVNFSEDLSLLGSSSTTKRGRGGDQSGYLSVDELKSTPGLSDTSSLDEFVMDGTTGGTFEPSNNSNQSRTGFVENGTCDSLESSMSSVTGGKHGNTAAAKANGTVRWRGGPGNTNSKCKSSSGAEVSCVLTHPFKLMSTYPISKSCPSIITTYHQCAFEAVDYMFFSPITCSTDGADKKRLTGFNLLKRKVLPSTHTLLDLGPQPHGYLSSDHLLLQATYQFSW